MKAVVATKQGASLQDIPTPEPGAGEILVRVHTAGLNRADLNTLSQGRGRPAHRHGMVGHGGRAWPGCGRFS